MNIKIYLIHDVALHMTSGYCMWLIYYEIYALVHFILVCFQEETNVPSQQDHEKLPSLDLILKGILLCCV